MAIEKDRSAANILSGRRFSGLLVFLCIPLVALLSVLGPGDASGLQCSDTNNGVSIAVSVTVNGVENITLGGEYVDSLGYYNCYYYADFPTISSLFQDNAQPVTMSASADYSWAYQFADFFGFYWLPYGDEPYGPGDSLGSDFGDTTEPVVRCDAEGQNCTPAYCAYYGEPDFPECKSPLSVGGALPVGSTGFYVSAYSTVNCNPCLLGAVDLSILARNTDELTAPVDGHPDIAGSPSDNPDTAFEGGDGQGQCSADGLPNYWVNTSTLNLVVTDTDFSYRRHGHTIAMTRTWNALPGIAGMFGNGWRFAYESVIKGIGNHTGSAYLMKGSGQLQNFKYLSHTADLAGNIVSVFTPEKAGIYDRLTNYAGTGYNYFIYEEKRTRLSYRYDYTSVSAGGVADYHLTSVADKNGNAVTISYNADGRISSITAPGGGATTFGYDANKRCASMTTPDSRTATYAYDGNGNLTQTVDLLGTNISYTYDAGNYMTTTTVGDKTVAYTWDTSGGWKHIASVVNAEGRTTRYAASSTTQTTRTDPRGGVTTYTNAGARTASITDPLAHTWTTGYDATSTLPVSTTDAEGRTSHREYDSRGNMTKYTDALGNITRYTYDADDNLTTITNALNQIWTYTYDGSSNLTGILSPLGKTESFVYDLQGRMTSWTDPEGKTWNFTHDGYGNLLTSEDPLGNTITLSYDAAGINRTGFEDQRNNTYSFTYDNNQRLIRIDNPGSTFRTFEYDACAMTALTDETGSRTELTRDKVLAITGITSPLNKVYSRTYDGNRNLLSAVNPLSETTGFSYDAADRINTVSNPLAGQVTMSYDANSNLNALSDELLQQTTFTYNGINLLLETTDSLNRTVYRTRDELGRIATYTNGRGSSISYTYNSDGLLTAWSGPGLNAGYGYDNAGRLMSITDAGSTVYERDAVGRVTKITYPDSHIVTFTYDAAGNVTHTGYPGSFGVDHEYNSRNRVSKTLWDSNTINLTYDGVGAVLSLTRSNSTSSEYTYDAHHRVTGIVHKKLTTPFAQMSFVRDDAGRIVQQTATLPQSPAPDTTSIWATYDRANQITGVQSDVYSHDLDGNMTTITGSRSFSAVYDVLNRPTSIANGATTTYSYNGIGQRVSASTGGQTRKYHYDHLGRLLFETDGLNAITVYYVYNGMVLAAQRTAAGASYFYHDNQLGSTVAITAGDGNIANSYAYSSYGEKTGFSETIYNPFTFVGAYGVMDEGNGIYYMKNRYYDSVTGRFIQKDPIGFRGGINLYGYVGNNPIDRIDPSGLDALAGGTVNVGFDPSNPFDNPEAADLRNINSAEALWRGYSSIPGSPGNSAMNAAEAWDKGNYGIFLFETGKSFLSGTCGIVTDILEKVLPAPPVDENGRVIPGEFVVPDMF